MTQIENYVEKIHALTTHTTLMPNGEYARVLVDNPVLTSEAPEYFRVSVPRKGLTFKVIEQANEVGLSVTDVWQHDVDKENDRVMLKVEPTGAPRDEQQERAAAL